MSAAENLFVNSVAAGAGNAYLTLRVGILARDYCRLSKGSDRRSLRRSAAMRAIPLLGAIVAEGSVAVASSIWARPKKFFRDLFDKIPWPWRSSTTPAN